MKVIGLAGIAQAGKSTAAKAIADSLLDRGFNPVLEQFAWPLKTSATMLGFHKGSERDHLYRKFCQFTGEIARQEDVNWWVILMRYRLGKLQTKENQGLKFNTDTGQWHETVVIIDDLRFENEIDLVKGFGGNTIFVSASRRIDTSEEWRQHTSESLAMGYEQGKFKDDLFDYTVSNNVKGGEEAFKRIVSGLAKKIVTSISKES